MSTKHRRLALIAAGLTAGLSAATPLSAQGWSFLPDGGIAYTQSYTTSGFFSCFGGGGFAPGSTCDVSGNTLTLGSGGSFMTLTFSGLTQTITATNERVPVASFGTITKTFSGSGPFQFPTPRNPNVLTFGFTLDITGAGTKRFGYIISQPGTTAAEVNCCGDDSGYSDYVGFAPPPPPPPFRYDGVVLNQFSDLTLRADATSINLGGAIGLVPEPATFALAGLGLAALGLAAARRRSA